MRITSDWHIHSENSCDSACMPVEDLAGCAEAKGILDFGLTDHLHTPYNLPDIIASRRDFLAGSPSPHFHFGIEVSVVSQWELAEMASGNRSDSVYGIRAGGPSGATLAIGLTDANIKEFGIEYVLGGAHWPMYVPLEREAVIRDYHRQNMFLAQHPRINIIGHPWWWMGHWQDTDGIYRTAPWFDDFRKIPRSMHDEFAEAAVKNGKLVEINLGANLLNAEYPERFKQQYLEYLAGLKEQGVKFSIGSDCHEADYHPEGFIRTARMLDSIGITETDLWSLPPRPDRP